MLNSIKRARARYFRWDFDRRQNRWHELIIIFLGVSLTGFAAFWYGQLHEKWVLQNFDNDNSQIFRYAEHEFKRLGEVLTACKGLFEASERVDQREWSEFVSTLGIDKNFSGVKGLGYVEYKNENHIVTKLFAPLNSDKILNVNFKDDPIRLAALRFSRDRNVPVLTDRVGFLQDPREQGHILYLPVFKRGQASSKANDQQKSLAGWVFAQIDEREVIEGINGHLPKKYEVHISDMMRYSKADSGENHASVDKQNRQMSRIHLLRFAEHEFPVTVTYAWQQELNERTAFQVAIIIIGVLFATLVLTLYMRLKTSEKMEKRAYDGLRRLYDAINGATMVSVADKGGRILSVNDKVVEITKYSREELIGQNHRILKSGLHDESFYKEMWGTILAGKVWRGEIANRSKDGEIYWIDCTIVPTLDQEGELDKFVSIRFDITEKKKRESERQAAEMQMAQTAQLTALGQMAGSVAHEVNTPLSAIIMNCEMLLEDLNSNELGSPALTKESIVEKVAGIMSIIWRVAKTIRVIKSLSREATREDLMPYNLSHLYDDALTLTKEKIIKNSIDLQSPSSDQMNFSIMCRGVDIPQVFMNLLHNAYDAVENCDPKEKWIKVEVVDLGFQEAKVEIAVSNGGPIIPPHVAKKIFEPFFTTKGVGRGTGLGLPVSKKIIEGLGGEFRFDLSGPHTRFVIRLPYQRTKDQELLAAG